MKLDIKKEIKGKTPVDKIVKTLLKNREIEDLDEFLKPTHPTKISFKSFFHKAAKYDKQFKKTMKLLEEIHKSQKHIVVYTDYDADGITGGAILWETLYRLGFKVMPYVPHRKREGYGFSKKGIDTTRRKYDPALIISVDHGITAHEEISYAQGLSLPIVVTDHHQRAKHDPKDAFAIFHTDKLSGSGVAYFFAKAVFEYFKSRSKKYEISQKTLQSLERTFQDDYLGFAAIGTVADLVPLTGPSRSIVKYGLPALTKTDRVGLNMMFKQAQIQNRDISTYEIGFVIAPRINAFGRLEHALDALRLLCTTNSDRARALSKKAGAINTVRQNLVEEAFAQVAQRVGKSETLFVVHNREWEEGILGLIASKLTQKFYRPSLVMTETDGFAKGSARSISGFDITKFLRGLSDHLIDVGGHPQAAGFTLKTEKIEDFTKAAKKQAEKQIKKEDLEPVTQVDLKTPLENLTLELAQAIEDLAPFGLGNPRPVFYSQGEISGMRLMGKARNHLKLYLKSDSADRREFVYFGGGKHQPHLAQQNTVGLVYRPGVNEWNGRRNVQGIVTLIAS